MRAHRNSYIILIVPKTFFPIILKASPFNLSCLSVSLSLCFSLRLSFFSLQQRIRSQINHKFIIVRCAWLDNALDSHRHKHNRTYTHNGYYIVYVIIIYIVIVDDEAGETSSQFILVQHFIQHARSESWFFDRFCMASPLLQSVYMNECVLLCCCIHIYITIQARICVCVCIIFLYKYSRTQF